MHVVTESNSGNLTAEEIVKSDFNIRDNKTEKTKRYFKALCNKYWEWSQNRELKLTATLEHKTVFSNNCIVFIDPNGNKYYCTRAYPKEAGMLEVKGFDMCIVGVDDQMKNISLKSVLDSKPNNNTSRLLALIKDIPELQQNSSKRTWISDNNQEQLMQDSILLLPEITSIKGEHFTTKQLANYNAIIIYVLDFVRCKPTNNSANIDLDATIGDLDLLAELVKKNPKIAVFSIWAVSAEVIKKEYIFLKNYQFLKIVPSAQNWIIKHDIKYTPTYYVLDKKLKIKGVFNDSSFIFNNNLSEDIQKVISRIQ